MSKATNVASAWHVCILLAQTDRLNLQHAQLHTQEIHCCTAIYVYVRVPVFLKGMT